MGISIMLENTSAFSMTSQGLFGHLRLDFWHMSLVHVFGFNLVFVVVFFGLQGNCPPSVR